jgi:hypothetical protein
MIYLWKFWVTVNNSSEWGYTNQERQVSPGRLNFVRCRLIVVGPWFGPCPISPFWCLEFWSGTKIFWITCRTLRVYYALFSNWDCTKYSLNRRKWLEEERVGVMVLGKGIAACSAFLLSLYWAPKLRGHVPADAGFHWDTAVVPGDTIKEMYCVIVRGAYNKHGICAVSVFITWWNGNAVRTIPCITP